MVQVRGRPDLGQEALGAADRGQLGFQDLERDLTFVLQVVGQEDGGHAAFAELALDGVAALEGGVEAIDGDGANGRGSAITLGGTGSNMAGKMHLT